VTTSPTSTPSDRTFRVRTTFNTVSIEHAARVTEQADGSIDIEDGQGLTIAHFKHSHLHYWFEVRNGVRVLGPDSPLGSSNTTPHEYA
jgi:hypothetical protein